ncbi:hypothetical protein DPMN_046727 [Dreissena polymorpha]|uniref:Uncharacterized protein n=1 Tax=Dreissena polymorpha TaxID=45954 RepID=A0A9D4I159_DREPO|nr:hypothetical protein DPMN_046727 [Dreissena polymorpha]
MSCILVARHGFFLLLGRRGCQGGPQGHSEGEGRRPQRGDGIQGHCQVGWNGG